MGLKLLAESSASVSEMCVMDFDGCGCILALGNPDGLDERFLEVAKGRAKQGQCGRKQGSLTGGSSQSCHASRFQITTVILIVHLGMHAMEHDFTMDI